MGDTPEIKTENHEPGVTLTEKPDEATKPSSNDAVGVNLDKDLLESLVNLEHELTGIDTRKTLAEGSRLCDEITMETNKITKLIDSLKTESKPTTEEIQQVIAGFTTKVNDLVKYHHDNKLTDKAEVDLLKTGVEKITAAVTSAEADPGQVEEAQRVLHIFIKNIDQVDGSYKAVRRRMSTTPTSPHVASPPRLNLDGHTRQESDSTTSSNQNTDRSAGGQSVPTTPTGKTDGGMKHASTTPDFKKKKSYSVSSKKSKSKLGDNEIEAQGEENKEEKPKRTHSRRTTLSLALPARKEKEQKDEEKQKEKDKKDKKSKTPREDGEKKKKFSIKDSWKRLTSAFVPNSKEEKRHTMAAADTGGSIDWDAPVSPRKEKKEREKLEKEKEKHEKELEKEREKQEKEREKQEKEKEPKSPRRLRLSLSMRKKTKSKRDDSMMIKSSPASTARGEGSLTDRSETLASPNPTPRTAREASSEEKAPGSNGKAATNSLKELPKTPEVLTPKPSEEKVPDTPKLAISPALTPAQGNTPRDPNSPRAVLVREISKKMLVARRAPSQQQLRQIKTKLSQMKLAWDEYTTGGLTTQDISEIDEHALDADIKELENLEGFDVDEIVNFEPDGAALDDANMIDELNALDNMLDEFDDEFDTPSMREPSSMPKVAGGSTSYLSAYD